MNREKVRIRCRKSVLKLRYGITPKDFEALLLLQEGRCAVCRTDEPGGVGWCVDHDHSAKRLRGILCSGCNSGTKLTDNIALLRAKIEYLTRPLLRVVG